MSGNGYRLGLYEKAMPESMTLDEKLRCGKACGFDYLELSIDESDGKLARLDWSADGRKALRELTFEADMPIVSICLSGHRRFPLGSADPAKEARALEIAEKAVALAADLGIRLIQLAGYDVYYEPSDEGTRARFAENLRRATDFAALYGVMLGFETMETEFMNTCAKAMEHVGTVRSPYLGLYPDTGNLTNSGADVRADLACARGHIFAAHLKETRPGVFREVPFGEGHTEFPMVIKELWEQGVGLFVGELWYDGVSEPYVYIREANKFLREQFMKAGGL